MIAIVEDVAQKAGKHQRKHSYFESKGIGITTYALPVGDYILMTRQIEEMLARKRHRGIPPKKMDFLGLYDRCVDSKFDVSELYSCMVQGHDRFKDEAELAKQNGIRLYILVENQFGFRSIDDLIAWNNPQFSKKRPKGKKPPVPNESFVKALKTFSERHGAIFRFVSPENAGRAVMYLLTGKDWGE